MSRVKIYIKTFDADGNLDSDWTEYTDYVDASSIGTLTQSLDNSEYNIGIVRNSNMTIKFDNRTGKFSSPDIVESIFRFKRSGSLVRVTYELTDSDLICGFFDAGAEDAILSEEITMFEGILNDDATADNTKDTSVQFQVLGYESLLQTILFPYSSVSDGDSLSTVVLACLNQAPFNTYVTVSALNISLSNNTLMDAKAGFENKSVMDCLKDILLAANSVMYINDNIVYVTARTASTSVEYTFEGQASDTGIENISEIKDIKTGMNRVFNSLTWKDTSLVQSDESSVSDHGSRIKEIDLDFITNNSRRNTVLSNILAEFKNPKKELTVKCCLRDEDILGVFLLDKVSVNYPQVQIAANLNTLPIYDQAQYDSGAVYSDSLYNLSIEAADEWKVMERKFDFKTETMEFKLRAV